MARREEPHTLIKRYARTRLYDTQAARYVTLLDLSDMQRAHRRFVVFDAASGRDVTQAVTAEIAAAGY